MAQVLRTHVHVHTCVLTLSQPTSIYINSMEERNLARPTCTRMRSCLVTTFAAQPNSDSLIPESGFSGSRTGGLKYDRMGEDGALQYIHRRDLIDANGNQRSNGLLDASAIIFSSLPTLLCIEKEKKIFVETFWSLLQKGSRGARHYQSIIPQPLSDLGKKSYTHRGTSPRW